MKSIVKSFSLISFSIISLLALAACGDSSATVTDSSALAARATRWSDSVISEDITVQVINGGINPDAFAYRLEAKVMAGSNPCMASTVAVRLVTEKVGRTLYVIGQAKDSAAADRICTMEFAPVFRTVELDVRGMSSKIDHVIIRNIGERGNDVAIESLLNLDSDTVVHAAAFTPTNGGINPDAWAVKVTGQVTLGSNPCFAAGAKARFVVEKEGSEYIVRAVIQVAETNRICTMQYQPVFAQVEAVVRGMRGDAERIVVRNAEVQGQDLVHELN